MNRLRKTAIALGVAQIALAYSGSSGAQEVPGNKDGEASTVVVVTGQRAALRSAAKIKQNSDEIVDSIVADDIGKLPDRSITEVLQRIVGVSIDRTMSRSDPEHFSVEGSGVTVRGLSYVRSELNGRDSFSANGGRALSFEDVPPELMAGVDVYKNPSAEQIEGAIGGLVNLRTAMPFDYKGFKLGASAETTYSELKKGKMSPGGSFLVSNRWQTGLGEFGALVDIASSNSEVRTDGFQVGAYFPRDVNGNRVYVPSTASFRSLTYDRTRQGLYGALQWKLNSDLRSSLTYFKSKYRMNWAENAIFAGIDPYLLTMSPDAVYDAKGAFKSGTLGTTDPAGIPFNGDTRAADRTSMTTDIAWNVEWRPTRAWTIKTDFQKIRATTRSFDSTVADGVFVSKETVDLSGDVPHVTFDAADRAHMADPNNYFWGFTMEHFDRSVANEKSARVDARYEFDDPVLRDVRFGVRLTDRDSLNTNSNPNYNWTGVTWPWMVGSQIPHVATMGDPRFNAPVLMQPFSNFFNGKADVPAMVFPGTSLATDYPGSYALLHSFHKTLCDEQNPGSGSTCDNWTIPAFGTDPAGVNDQHEKTKAFFTQLRFGWDDLKYPVDGNVGIRYVKTTMNAGGYITFTPPGYVPPTGYAISGVAVPRIPAYAQSQTFENSYGNFLPSLNLKMKISPEFQMRLGLSSGLSRPDFSQLQAYTSLSQTVNTVQNDQTKTQTVTSMELNGSASGNPKLKPTTSKQIDLTGEYYFGAGNSFTVAVFNKQLKDIVTTQLSQYALPDDGGNLHDFVISTPVNGAKGVARGMEVAYQQYFDKLPGWMSGIGMQANFTFIDSKRTLYKPVYSTYCSSVSGAANLNLNENGCDTNGRAFGNMPLQGLSRTAFNLALLYDKGAWSARLAYSWRSKSLQGVNANGTAGGGALDTNPDSPTYGQHVIQFGLPTFADAYGQLDGGISYQINDHVKIALDGTNLTNAIWRQTMQQTPGMLGRAWFVSGRRYAAKMNLSF